MIGIASNKMFSGLMSLQRCVACASQFSMRRIHGVIPSQSNPPVHNALLLVQVPDTVRDLQNDVP